jgi:hypothetical protein
MVGEIENMLNNMTASRLSINFSVNKDKMIGGLGREAVKALVLKYWDEKKKNQVILEEIYKQLSLLGSMDFILACNNSKAVEKNEALITNLKNYYLDNKIESFTHFLQNKVTFSKWKGGVSKYVIYTYTNVLEQLELPKNKVQYVDEFKIGGFKKEKDVEKYLKSFFSESEK